MKYICLCALLAAACAAGAAEPAAGAAGAGAPEKTELSAQAQQLVGAIEQTLVLLEAHAIAVPPQAAQAAVDALLKSIDPAAAFLSAEEAKRVQEEEQGIFQEAGLRLRIKDGAPVVDAIIEEGPASKAEIKPDDILVRIGADSVDGLPVEELEARLRGNPGDVVELWVKSRKDGEPRKVELPLGPVAKPVIETAEKWPQNICYARINGLYRGSGTILKQSFAKWDLPQTAGLIIDLRWAAGVDLQAVVEAASMFVPEKTLLFKTYDGSGREKEVFVAAAPDTGLIKIPVIVLVDSKTRGAAELFAAILQKYSRALLIGENTAGDDRIRRILEAGEDRYLYVAVGHAAPADGVAYRGAGVRPDIYISGKEAELFAAGTDAAKEEKRTSFAALTEGEIDARGLRKRIGRDAALSRAADILLGLKALNIRGAD